MTDPQTAADAAEQVQAWIDKCDRVAEAEGGWAYVFGPEDTVFADALRELLADRKRLADELKQVRRGVTLPILRQAWRNGWSDRARAVRDAVRTSDNERDAYERAFARYMSEDPAEADKDPYRPLDGPDDPAAVPTRPAGGLTGAPEGQRLSTPENGAQRGAEGDETNGSGR